MYYKLSAMQPEMMREVKCQDLEVKYGLLKLYSGTEVIEVFRMYMVDRIEVRHAE